MLSKIERADIALRVYRKFPASAFFHHNILGEHFRSKECRFEEVDNPPVRIGFERACLGWALSPVPQEIAGDVLKWMWIFMRTRELTGNDEEFRFNYLAYFDRRGIRVALPSREKVIELFEEVKRLVETGRP
ncbi:MAG TPA: hypothetical protein VNQ34_11645 [Xanthobacteraceae bacterium]|nr:hypothetical protein [Xanthobacteraceae bacterium]